jgi:hypothetical protein
MGLLKWEVVCRMAKIRVYFCPKCESFSVKYINEFGNFFCVIPKMKCLDCKFISSGFPILVTTKEEVEKYVAKMKKKKAKKGKSVKKKVVKKTKKVGRKRK